MIAGAIDDRVFDAMAALGRFARERGRTLADLAIAALLAQPVVSSVPTGASTPDQIRANAATADSPLSDEDNTLLRELVERLATDTGRPVASIS